MKSIFLSHKQVFDSPLPLFSMIGPLAGASDLVMLSVRDDGVTFSDGYVNYYLAEGQCVDRFGRDKECDQLAVRPVFLLEPGDEKLLKHVRESGDMATAEFGAYPATLLESSLRDMAEREYRDGTLPKTDLVYTVRGEKLPVYRLGAKQVIRVAAEEGGVNGYIKLSDGSAITEGEEVFIEVKPVRWYLDKANKMLVSGKALIAGLDREAAAEYLNGEFLNELTAEDKVDSAAGGSDADTAGGYRVAEHDELSLIEEFVKADLPVFIHGLAGDGKSDRVKEIDPKVLDIELVNETPETINGRTIFNEAKNEIIDVKPVWLVRLEELCEDGELHILFFDELTNATKQTQSVIFKIVLERVVNNRWPLPPNARIVAAGNDRSESSVAHDLAEPLFGRFAHIYINTTVENWMPWAIKKEINPYVMEFLANNDLYLRTAFTGTEGYADPRRWEMASRVLDSSGNDFALLEPIVGRETADAFIKFFRAQEHLAELASYTDKEIAALTSARRYQIAQHCLYASSAQPKEARALVERLGPEFLAWFEYVLERKAKLAGKIV